MFSLLMGSSSENLPFRVPLSSVSGPEDVSHLMAIYGIRSEVAIPFKCTNTGQSPIAITAIRLSFSSLHTFFYQSIIQLEVLILIHIHIQHNKICVLTQFGELIAIVAMHFVQCVLELKQTRFVETIHDLCRIHGDLFHILIRIIVKNTFILIQTHI